MLEHIISAIGQFTIGLAGIAAVLGLAGTLAVLAETYGRKA